MKSWSKCKCGFIERWGKKKEDEKEKRNAIKRKTQENEWQDFLPRSHDANIIRMADHTIIGMPITLRLHRACMAMRVAVQFGHCMTTTCNLINHPHPSV